MALLETVRLTKKFGGFTAVDSVDLEIHEGEILGLIGPNGAGKTTIFNVINGFYRPSAGYIFFRGEKIDGLKPTAICKKGIGRTFQVVKPLARLSLVENVMASTFLHTSSVAEARRRAQELLGFVGLASQRDVIDRNLTLGGANAWKWPGVWGPSPGSFFSTRSWQVSTPPKQARLSKPSGRSGKRALQFSSSNT